MAEIGNIFLPNILSPFDVSAIVENLVKFRQKILTDPLNNRKNLIQEKRQALSTLKNNVIELLATAQILSSQISYKVFKPALTNITGSENPSNIISVSAGPDAVASNFDVQVNQLAQAWKVGSAVFSSSSVTLSSLGVTTGEIIAIKGTDKGNAKVLRLDPNWTISQLRDKINELNAGVTAYLVSEGGGVRLIIAGTKTGESREFMTLADVSGNALQDLGFTGGTLSRKYDTLPAGEYQSDAFTKKDVVVGTLLGLNTASGEAPSGTITINGTPISIDLNTMTLEDIRNAINASGSGATATILEEGGVFRLKITGATSISDDNHVLETLGVLAQNYSNVVSAGQNAQISIDGNIFTSQDNTFTPEETGITGVTFTALRASTDVIRVSITRDIDKIIKYFQDLAQSWNKVVDFIKSQITFDQKKKSAGPLSGESVLLAVDSAMRRALSGIIEIPQMDASFKTYSITSLGLSLDREGKLSVDVSKLRSALEADFEGVVRALTSSIEKKIVSSGFASADTSLGISGEILVNGKSVVINPSDTLRQIAQKINSVSDTARAYIKSVSGQYKLIIENLQSGLPDLKEVSGNVLSDLGLASTSFITKNKVSLYILKTDTFFSDTQPVRNVVDQDSSTSDTANNISGTITFKLQDGTTVTTSVIDISSDSLSDIVTKINSAAGSSIAEVKTTVVDGRVKYYIQISGVITDPNEWLDTTGGKLLQFLGILKKDENDQSFNKGFAERLRENLAAVTGSNGAIGLTESRFQGELTGIDKDLERISEEIEQFRASLYQRWARANQLIAQANNMLQFFRMLSSALIQGVSNPFVSSGQRR
ncbi:MAG: flagellar filament capping protein FliD [Candidatus Calescibacterium sp.]